MTKLHSDKNANSVLSLIHILERSYVNVTYLSYSQAQKLLKIHMKYNLETHGEHLVVCKTSESKVVLSNCLVSIVLWTGQVLVE